MALKANALTDLATAKIHLEIQVPTQLKILRWNGLSIPLPSLSRAIVVASLSPKPLPSIKTADCQIGSC